MLDDDGDAAPDQDIGFPAIHRDDVRLGQYFCLAFGDQRIQICLKEEGKTFRKVPILGDIPLLGKLFQSHGKSLEESEIIILIRADVME